VTGPAVFVLVGSERRRVQQAIEFVLNAAKTAPCAQFNQLSSWHTITRLGQASSAKTISVPRN